MKVPGGWKAFFKNVIVAAAIIYGLNYLLSNQPSILGSTILGVVICLMAAFIESRVRPVTSNRNNNPPVAETVTGSLPKPSQD